MNLQGSNRSAPPPWYAEGLRFGCQACGRCCGGAPGYVWMDEQELAAMASQVGLAAADFRRIYTRSLWRGMSLREKANYDCVLLGENGRCSVYEARPVQCRTWPFWDSNLADRESWEEAGCRCPGIGHGPVYALEQIEALRMEMSV